MPELVLPVQPQAEVVVNTMNMTTIDPLSMINIEKDLFKILNQWTTREANGQTPIDRNKTIAQTAKDHIRDMLEMSPKYFQFKDEMEGWENWSSQLLIKRLQESEDNTKIDRSTDLEKVRAIAKEAMFDNQKSGNTLTIIGKLRLLMEGQEPKDEINLRNIRSKRGEEIKSVRNTPTTTTTTTRTRGEKPFQERQVNPTFYVTVVEE